MPLLLALLAAVAAFLSYRFFEEWTGKSWLPAALRSLGWGTLALLLLNVSCPGSSAGRPLVLLDGSLSMQSAGGRWTEALALARGLGEVRLVGPPAGDSTPSAGRTRFAPAIAAAQSSGRRVILVSDGEVEDADELPAPGQPGPEIRLLPRPAQPDLALTRVEASSRVTPGDSLRIDVEVRSVGARPSGPLRLEAKEGSRVWLSGSLTLDAGGHGTASLRGPLPQVGAGSHVVSVGLVNAGDAEPRDDTRLLVITVVPTPGIVLLASPPTWESRFLLDALRTTSALPVRGYLEIEPGTWRQAGELTVASTAEVGEVARRADLLVSLGTTTALTRGSRARGRWSWPATSRLAPAGDWYVSAPPSPVSGSFATLALDSFPPGTAIVELSPGPRDWVGLTAQASRRGTVRPVLLGRDSARVRQVVTGIDGLWRWGFRGGSSEQGYRALVANVVSWLLGGADSASGRARLQRNVVQRGRPAVFEWTGGAPVEPLAIEWNGPGATRRDTLVFDGAGRAEVRLPPGAWRYRISGGGEGLLAVEAFSDEFVPGRVTLTERSGGAASAVTRRPLRALVWLFAATVLAFSGEWLVRRRLGLR